MSRWMLHAIERVVMAAIAAFVASAAALPGGFTNSDNLKIAGGAAVAAGLAALLGKKVGDPNSPALIPMAAEALVKGGVVTVTGTVEKGLDETVGKIPVAGEIVTDTVTSVDNIVEDTAGSVAGNVTGLLGGLLGAFKKKKPGNG